MVLKIKLPKKMIEIINFVYTLTIKNATLTVKNAQIQNTIEIKRRV